MSKGAGVRGGVKYRAPHFLKGWAFDSDRPQTRLQVEVLVDGRFVAVATADGLRDDLVKDGVGDGRYGFRMNLQGNLGRGETLVVRPVGSVTPLPGGEIKLLGGGRDGLVTSPGYLDSEEDQKTLASLPIESLAYGAQHLSFHRLLSRWSNRLRRERNASAFTTAPPVVLLGVGGLRSSTLDVWALQSAPGVDAMDLTAESLSKLSSYGWTVLAGPDDLPHPSTAYILATYRDLDVVVWRRFVADAARAGAQGLSIGKPAFDPATARHGALSDTTLAIRSHLLAEAPADVTVPLAAGRIHPLIVWLAGRGLRWGQHPEALTSSLGSPPSLCRETIAEDIVAVERLLHDDGDDLILTERPSTDAFPYVLWPRRRPVEISVIICFRNGAPATIRCLRSIARQRTTARVEIVLVDNQSDAAARNAVASAAKSLFDLVTTTTYDAPFNHSAQNNLAVELARGEVLIFANNDVVLEAEDTLEALGAWAFQPGVGLVGCRLLNPLRGLPSFGLAYTPAANDPFAPIMRESDTAAPWPIRAAAGATLALAAMRRDRYLELGGLDASRFPVGYNDVDLSLRATAAGLVHLFLDHVGGEHARGSSRTGDNEDSQIASASSCAHSVVRRFEQVGTLRTDGAHDTPRQANAISTADHSNQMSLTAGALEALEVRAAALATSLRNEAGALERRRAAVGNLAALLDPSRK